MSAVERALNPVTRPLERDLLDSKVRYAWRTEDVPIVESALKLLGELVAGGFLSPAFLGAGLVELVGLLIRLRKNRAAIRDPAQLAVLLALRDGPPGGMTALAVSKELAKADKPLVNGRSEVEKVLQTLATPEKDLRPQPLVQRIENTWKSLV
jgi:hypothetical protein